MTHISLQEVESNLHALVQRIRSGEELVLEQDGVPFCTVTPLLVVRPLQRDVSKRIGFLEGHGSFPENWKEIGQEDMDASLDRIDRL